MGNYLRRYQSLGIPVNEKSPILGLLPDLDDPQFAQKLGAYKERANQLAVSHGLPRIGSRMTNAHGIEWVVDGHTFARNAGTLGRVTDVEDPRELYPVVVPQNIGPRLQRVLDQLHLCTPKEFMPLDTVPHLRPAFAHPFGHSVDSISDPYRILFFLDAARISEPVFAHEVGHVWIEVVEGIEDYRVLKDLSEVTRYNQVQHLQSFVLDFAVNGFLKRRGFDLSEIEEDRRKSLTQLEASVSGGYRPPTPWESVFIATFLAETMVETEGALLRADSTLDKVRADLPDEWMLAKTLADAVNQNPPTSPASAIRSIDRVLTLCFAHAGEHLDLDADLAHIPPAVYWHDKLPQWLHSLTPQDKCEVGKAIARADLGARGQVQLRPNGATTLARFTEDNENWTEWVSLPFRHAGAPFSPSEADRIMEINERNRRNVMNSMNSPIPHMPGRRSYSPGMARWLTQVRMAEYLGGEHPYSYALNNPVSYVDPDGLKPQKAGRRIKPHQLPPYAGGIGGGYDYGAYCGPANKRNPAWHVLPQDCIDACCQKHDRCLEAQYGAGIGGGAAHAYCDPQLRDCADDARRGCCASSPTPLGCEWAAETIYLIFDRMSALNPIPVVNPVPPNFWMKYSRINWGGAGQCEEKSVPTGYGRRPIYPSSPPSAPGYDPTPYPGQNVGTPGNPKYV